jgi:hypothetical protein
MEPGETEKRLLTNSKQSLHKPSRTSTYYRDRDKVLGMLQPSDIFFRTASKLCGMNLPERVRLPEA